MAEISEKCGACGMGWIFLSEHRPTQCPTCQTPWAPAAQGGRWSDAERTDVAIAAGRWTAAEHLAYLAKCPGRPLRVSNIEFSADGLDAILDMRDREKTLRRQDDTTVTHGLSPYQPGAAAGGEHAALQRGCCQASDPCAECIKAGLETAQPSCAGRGCRHGAPCDWHASMKPPEGARPDALFAVGDMVTCVSFGGIWQVMSAMDALGFYDLCREVRAYRMKTTAEQRWLRPTKRGTGR